MGKGDNQRPAFVSPETVAENHERALGARRRASCPQCGGPILFHIVSLPGAGWAAADRCKRECGWVDERQVTR